MPDTLSPLGQLLAERQISAKALAEAIGIAEGREDRPRTTWVMEWVRGRKRPQPGRQRLIAGLLEVAVQDIFPPLPKAHRPPPKQELDLLARAGQRQPADSDPASDLLHRASAQQKLSRSRPVSGDNTAHGAPLHVMSTRRKGGKASKRKPRPRPREKVAV